MNAAALIAVVFGLVSVIVSTAASFVPIELGAKDFATASPLSTVSDAFAAIVFAPALAVVNPPIAMVLL